MWIRGEPRNGTERDLISNCGAFLGLGLGSLFAHLGRGGEEPALVSGVEQGHSPQETLAPPWWAVQ